MADTNKEGTVVTPPTQAEQEVASLQKAADSGSFKLPDNFKTVQEFYDSYKNLQAHATQVSQENAELKKSKTETKPVDDLASALETPEGETTEGIDWPSIEKELQSKGDLSPETRKALSDAKIPASMIEAQVTAHKIKRAEDAKQAADLVGGQDELQRVLEWGKKNLSKDDASVVSEQLRGPGWKLALLGLAKMAASPKDGEPRDMTTVGGAASGAEPYGSQAEMSRDVRDPRYSQQLDPKFVKAVQARMYATQKANTKK